MNTKNLVLLLSFIFAHATTFTNPLIISRNIAKQTACSLQKRTMIIYKSKRFGDITCANHIVVAAQKASDNGEINKGAQLLKLSFEFEQMPDIKNHPYYEQMQHALILGQFDLAKSLYDKSIKNKAQKAAPKTIFIIINGKAVACDNRIHAAALEAASNSDWNKTNKLFELAYTYKHDAVVTSNPNYEEAQDAVIAGKYNKAKDLLAQGLNSFKE